MKRSLAGLVAGAAMCAPVAAATSSTTSPSAPTSTSSTVVERALDLKLDAKGALEASALPDEGDLFTRNELAHVIPGLESVTKENDGLLLRLKGEPADNRSRIDVTYKRFGRKADVTRRWAQERSAHEKRSARMPGLYSFFGPDAHGVADSFSDGTNLHVLVQHGEVAGEIWLSGIGFSNLASTHEQSRAAYRARVVPALVDLLGAKVAKGTTSVEKDKNAPS